MSSCPKDFDLAAYYAMQHRRLVAIGKKHGYAIALHGSMARDLDVVAIPWTEDACSAEDLIAALVEDSAFGYIRSGDDEPQLWSEGPTEKPHGRQAWSIHFDGNAYMDISIMPRVP